ncbi:hypothetical protein CEB3_c09750 [Peptococcaceae bacterium CEB3]|nr:hypothetical protein CEB3_c09750 [Peptococcaceae bacterium CEB3]
MSPEEQKSAGANPVETDAAGAAPRVKPGGIFSAKKRLRFSKKIGKFYNLEEGFSPEVANSTTQ